MPSLLGVNEIDHCGLSCLGNPTVHFEDSDGEVTSIPYQKLPPHLLRLSILKLDGSSFDVLIKKNATVGQLKEAIEDLFIAPTNKGANQISWSHVWGNFCLSYDGWKLLNDRSYVREFSIMDGDQLRFVRHASINYSPMRRRSKSLNHANRHAALSVSVEPEDHSPYNESKHIKDSNHPDREYPPQEFKLSQFLRGCLSPSGQKGMNRKGWRTKERPPRFVMQCFSCGHNGYAAMDVSEP